MYESTVGRGANFLLNIGPDERGLLAPEDVTRLHELAAEIRRRYFIPLPFEAIVMKDGKYEISYSKETYGMISDTVNLPLVRRVVIEEDITEGESVKQWRLIATIPSKYPYTDWEVCLCEVTESDTSGSARCRLSVLPDSTRSSGPRWRL